MSEQEFRLRDAVTLKNFVCSGLPGLIETTLNMPLITGLNMLVATGKITWTPKELYRGWTVVSPPYIPYSFTMFTAKNLLYSKFPYRIMKNGKVVGINIPRAVLVGGLAGTLASVVCTPIERIQVYQNSNKVSLSDAIKEIVTGQGYKGIYNGYIGILFREILFTIALFSVSDYFDTFFRTKVFPKVVEKSPGLGGIVVSSISRFLSGAAIGVATCPFNNIRIVQQGVSASQKKLGFLTAAKQLTSEGRLMDGWSFRVGRIGLAIIWVRAAESMLYKLFKD